jgi:putative Mg2+ transporter-C (MgtC) family protein
MQQIWRDTVASYWSISQISANLAIFLTLIGALLLGLVVGYERTYHGRAVGMRTYGLVCMASAALTTFVGYPSLWYGGHGSPTLGTDPTRVVQGILTGIGFLGSGVIMKDGLNIRGLTTAASVWTAAVIGILVGVGFYGAAILLSGLSTLCMHWIHRLEIWLPSRDGIAVVIQFTIGAELTDDGLHSLIQAYGYRMAEGSLSIALRDGMSEWHFIATAMHKPAKTSMAELARVMSASTRIAGFQLAHCRN